MKKLNFLVILFLTLSLTGFVLADDVFPCRFYGTLVVNENNTGFNSTSVTAYVNNSENLVEASFSYPNPDATAGKYGIDVNNLDSEIIFKINGHSVDQKAQLCESKGESNWINLDLTATIDNFDGSTEEDVTTENVDDLNVFVGGSSDLTQGFFGEQEVEFKDGADTLVVFDYDFDSGSLNFSAITITVNNSSKGAISISGINLTSGQTKTAYIDNLAGEDYVCVLDEEDATISEMTAGCSGVGEVVVKCDGALYSGYTCNDLGARLKVTGLTHSAVSESTYAPVVTTTSSGGGGGGGGGSSCATKWTCTDWSVCLSSGTQIRTCSYPANVCRPTTARPAEAQDCNYTAPLNEEINLLQEGTTPSQSSPTGGQTPITGAAVGTGLTSPKGIGIAIAVVILLIGAVLLVRRYSNKK